MTTATLQGRNTLMTTTDHARAGRGDADLADLTNDLSRALNGAYWSYMLRAELEDAFDSALLRAAIAETPTISGVGPI